MPGLRSFAPIPGALDFVVVIAAAIAVPPRALSIDELNLAAPAMNTLAESAKFPAKAAVVGIEFVAAHVIAAMILGNAASAPGFYSNPRRKGSAL